MPVPTSPVMHTKPLDSVEPEPKMGQRLGMLRGEKEVARIRRQPERLVLEPEELLVHRRHLLSRAARCCTVARSKAHQAFQLPENHLWLKNATRGFHN